MKKKNKENEGQNEIHGDEEDQDLVLDEYFSDDGKKSRLEVDSERYIVIYLTIPILLYCPLGQSVERLPYNRKVLDSVPVSVHSTCE